MLRALWHARSHINERFRANPRNRELFLQMFREPNGLTRGLRRMNLYGVLGRYLPNFGHIVGQMQHDLFHVYTVDEHILMVVRNLRRFASSAFTHEYPLMSRLINDFERPETLYLAGLFHDIAKGRGGDHSALGMVDALEFCRQHGLPPQDGELVAWLVGQHLTMSSVAQKQDIYDPETVSRFAELVGTPRRLTALYLLTVADIRGTSPKVWNAWKAKLLEDLYHAAMRQLVRGGQWTSPPSWRNASTRPRRCCACTRCRTAWKPPCGSSWTPSTFCAMRPRKSPGTRACSTASSTPSSPWCARGCPTTTKASRC